MSGGADSVDRSSPTRAEILDAAAKIIVSGGYAACTMRAVAERVKIKAGSLYYHFRSKDDIIEEILNSGIAALLDQVGSRLGQLPANASFKERVVVAVEAHLACMIGGETGHMNVYEHLPPVLKRRSRKMRDTYAGLWFELFTFGVEQKEVDRDLDLTLFVPYFLGGLNRVPEWFRPRKAKSSDVAAMAAETLLHGVLAGKTVRTSAASRKAA
ncbi:TetR/AcrR family transcriptional regulator [Micromonospora sp. STR1s_5]|nr:TetR/AcrR family transcriptional regulator [Micromonospora sp. STR1s_5]